MGTTLLGRVVVQRDWRARVKLLENPIVYNAIDSAARRSRSRSRRGTMRRRPSTTASAPDPSRRTTWRPGESRPDGLEGAATWRHAPARPRRPRKVQGPPVTVVIIRRESGECCPSDSTEACPNDRHDCRTTGPPDTSPPGKRGHRRGAGLAVAVARLAPEPAPTPLPMTTPAPISGAAVGAGSPTPAPVRTDGVRAEAERLRDMDPVKVARSVASEDAAAKRASVPLPPSKGSGGWGPSGRTSWGRAWRPARTSPPARRGRATLAGCRFDPAMSSSRSAPVSAGTSSPEDGDGFFETSHCQNWHKIA